MAKKPAAFVIGCVAVYILGANIPAASSLEDHGCKIFIEDDILKANCRRMKITTIPQDLDPNIKHLDLSNNTLNNPQGSHFKRYKNLEVLKMHVVEAKFNSSANLYYLFRSLTKLKQLLLNYNEQLWTLNGQMIDPTFRFPANLKILSLMDNAIINLDVSNLKKLEQLDLYDNDVQVFPTFHPLAPVKSINLTRTNMRRIRAEDLAPLCSLEYLGLSQLYLGGLELFRPEKYCECKRLVAWMEKFGIRTHSKEIKCVARHETCDLEFSQDILSVRENCLARKNSHGWIIFVLVFIAIVAAGSAAGGYYYHYWWQESEVKE